ncbi:unnamed protein product, partial [Ixodes persulcatus]
DRQRQPGNRRQGNLSADRYEYQRAFLQHSREPRTQAQRVSMHPRDLFTVQKKSPIVVRLYIY